MKISPLHCRMQKEGDLLMRLPCTSSSPARHPLVRSQPAPRNQHRDQHRALKRPSLLTIAPRHQQLVRKTALPAHDRSQTPALVRKTSLPAHDSPPTPALVRKTALPAHGRSPTPALVRKTALPAHDRPPTPALVRKTALPAHGKAVTTIPCEQCHRTSSPNHSRVTSFQDFPTTTGG